jgi:hypothetical protein
MLPVCIVPEAILNKAAEALEASIEAVSEV